MRSRKAIDTRRSSLLGRESELEDLSRAVARHRIVSMTGAPGVGKSAVAAAFATLQPSVVAGLGDAFDADSVCRVVARALGVPHVPTATVAATATQIGRAIASRGRVVVILDDADRARAELARFVPTWAAGAPLARFLVAARGRVAIPSAQRFELGPLEVPSERERDRTVIERTPAVILFVRAAALVRPSYRLSAENARHVAAIVRILDGLPLAIELCAARVVALGEAEIAAILTERLDALDGSSAAKGGRTLRGAFDLSWDQLSTFDARVLAACSAFRGSFDLDAAVAITGEPRLRAAEALERLDEASLVHAFEPPELPGARRHAMPAIVRVFARDRLLLPEETARRHAEHFGTLSAAAPGRADVLALDRENLESALAWATAEGLKPLAARVALGLAPLALGRGPLVPFMRHIDELLGARGLPRALSAELYLVRALARIHRGRRDDALRDLGAARRLAARIGETRIEVLATSKTGLIRGLKGQFEVASGHFDEATALLDASAGPWLRGVVAKDHANVLAEQGLNADAMVELAHARDLFHVAGDVREEGFVLMMLGSRLLDDGRLRDGRRDCTAGLAQLRRAGDHRSAAWCEVLLALLDAEDGDFGSARTRLDGALTAFRVIGDAHTQGLVLGYLGNVALEQGALVDAESFYRDARLLLAEASDKGSEAMCAAGAGVVEAALGRLAAARERFAQAARLLQDDGRAARREAVAVLAQVLDPCAVLVKARAVPAEEVRFAQRVLGAFIIKRRRKVAPPAPAAVLIVATDGSWLRTPDGTTAKFAKGALRGIVRRLAQDRVRYPGREIAAAALVRAGWPAESIMPAAAKNRVHVTLARLRRAGLAGLLIRGDDGYSLDASVPARFADDDERP
jgi:predicted ATPase